MTIDLDTSDRFRKLVLNVGEAIVDGSSEKIKQASDVAVKSMESGMFSGRDIADALKKALLNLRIKTEETEQNG